MRARDSVLVTVLCVLTVLVVAATARADSDRIVISANARTSSEFPVTFNPIDQSFPEAGETTNPFTFFIGFRPSTPTNPHGQTFNTAVELMEADGTISDIVELSVVATFDTTGTPLGQNWTLNFVSDTESPLSPPTGLVGPAFQLQENGGLQDISGDFLNSDGVTRITPLFNVVVQSDVPEPSILLLLGSGLVGLVGCGRNRKNFRS